MSNIEILHTLCRRLSASEQQFIEKLLPQVAAAKKEADYILLYRVLHSVVVCQELEIYRLWLHKNPKGKSDKNYIDCQGQLKQFLLHALVQANPNMLPNKQDEQIHIARQYKLKGMYNAAFDCLENALNIFEEQNEPYYRSFILYQMLSLGPSITLSHKETRLAELLKLAEFEAQELVKYTAVHALNIEVGIVVMATGAPKKLTDRQRLAVFLTNPLLTKPIDAESHTIATSILKTKSWLYRLMGSFDNLYEQQQLLITILRQHTDALLKYKPDVLFGQLADYADACMRVRRYDEAQTLLEELQTLLIYMPQPCTDKQLIILNSRANLNYYNPESNAETSYLQDLDGLCYKHFKKLPPVLNIVCALTLIKTYLQQGNYEKLIVWHKLVEPIKQLNRQDSKNLCHLLYIFCLYEQCPVAENLRYIDVSTTFIKETHRLRRKFNASADEIPFEKIVADVMIALGEHRETKHHVALFQKMQKRLGQLAGEGFIYQEQLYTTFDMRLWITEQIERLKTGQNKKALP